MKKLFLLPLLAILILLVSCEKNNEITGFPPSMTDATYEGAFTIGAIDSDISCEIDYNESLSECDIIINGLKFSPYMPEVNMTLPSLPCSVTDDGLVFAATEPIIPIVSVSGVAKSDSTYMVREFSGSLRENVLSFKGKMAMGEFFFMGDEVANDSVVFPDVTPSDSTFIPDVTPSDSTFIPDVTPSDSILTPGDKFIIPDGHFNGVLDVVAIDSSMFVCENVVCETVVSHKEGLLDLYIYGAKFAEAMPITIDILLENIPFVTDNERACSIHARDIVPLIAMPDGKYVPNEAFKFYRLYGVIIEQNDGMKLSFSADMTRGTFSFR